MAPAAKRQRLSKEDPGDIAKSAVQKLVADSEIIPSKNDKKPQSRRSLFVRSLASTTTSESLTEHFSQDFPIKHATAVIDPSTKQCKGYGFVTFADAEDAERARVQFNGSVLEGRKIKVETAEPRQRDAAATTGTNAEGTSTRVATSEAKAARERAKSEALQPPKLIVRNLPWSIKEPEQLAVLFRSYGKVKHATIPKKKPGLMAGFGFVVMRGKKNADKALQAINGKEIDGRTLAVDWAVEKEVWQNLQNEEGRGKQESHVEEQTRDDESKGEDDDPDASAEDGFGNGVPLNDEASISADEEGSSTEDDLPGLGIDRAFEDGNESIISPKARDNTCTLFIRNLPFTSTDDSLRDHFAQFGPIRYARVVLDQVTERPKGTAFVCFFRQEDADACLRGAPRPQKPEPSKTKRNETTSMLQHSVLQDEYADPSGRYTMDGRILQVSRAVDRAEASKLTEEGVKSRNVRDRDKRRLYLLSEGTISSTSPLYQLLSPSEIAIRETSAKQRKALIQTNPSLHLSLTRLSVRNIPRNVTSKDLKALAREAVVGFATDVKAGKRQPLSKEELARGGDEMKEAEKQRKLAGKGIVKQAKIVFEGREGGKISEETGAGRSRGYGFIEYHSHRSALMGLRWLNGHAVGYRAAKNDKSSREDAQDKKKRLIVEFAIENAQVVGRRKERESKAREKTKVGGREAREDDSKSGGDRHEAKKSKKRAREANEGDSASNVAPNAASAADEKLAKRQRIIAKKRMLRRSRKKEAKA